MTKNYLNLLYLFFLSAAGAFAQEPNFARAEFPRRATELSADAATLISEATGSEPGELSGSDPLADPPEKRINLIPVPVNMEPLQGVFLLDTLTPFLIDPNKAELKELASFFAEMIALPTGYSFPVSAAAKDASAKEHGRKGIFLRLNDVQDPLIGGEGYRLEVLPGAVRISANKPAGLFYGMQTLMQLLPEQIGSKIPVKDADWSLPCVRITDFPRFGWRGLMLDVSRHFFPMPFVKKYIDQLAKYKMNVFHWHLTDDQGWRIEIKSLPKLTSVGAWRVPRTGTWWEREPPQPGESASYGGFYTQDEVREIIRYAGKRFVTILPEIDVPGHSLAALAAYPEYACVDDDFHVNPGSKFYGKTDNSLCAGNEKTYEFLDKVFAEVARLFPGPYIHMGGDEAYKGFWKKCPKCQRKMQSEGLKNVDQLQSYFVKRVEKILHAHGKKLIGWDEILEGGLAPEATVMSWRGMSGGIRSAKMGHHVIMTPNTHCYLDLYQGDPALEPPTYSQLRLTDAYQWDPVPEEVNKDWILGGQGNLWTESVPNPRHAEYMTWPRALALAEVFWSPKERKSWEGFIARMEAHFKRFDAAEVNYSESAYDPIVTPRWSSDKKEMLVTLRTEIPGLNLFYTFDGTYPDKFLNEYRGEPLRVPKDADTFRVVAYKNGKPVGKMLSYKISNLYGKLPAPM